MAVDFKSPSDVADEFLTHLKSLKPEVNTNQTDSDWYVRGHVIGGVVSGAYADQKKIAGDIFPQSARREAMSNHLSTWFDGGFNDPTNARGPVKVTGASGSFVASGALELLYEANGNTYVSEEDFTMPAAGSGTVNVISVSTGQAQNLLVNSPLKISSPPAGFDAAAIVFGDPISDGRDAETLDEAAARVLTRMRNPISGGKGSDYEQWAKEADPSVVSANGVRYAFGLGTVGVVLTAGTTDIDQALDNGDPIVLTPSDELVAIVQAYLETKRPINDCVYVFGATPIALDVTISVKFSQGTGSTVLSGQTLTQKQLVQREVQRALYKTPVGGRKIGTVGYAMASDVEEVVDIGLSALPYVGGVLPIILDRQVSNLSATGANRLLASTEFVTPGTITVVEL